MSFGYIIGNNDNFIKIYSIKDSNIKILIFSNIKISEVLPIFPKKISNVVT